MNDKFSCKFEDAKSKKIFQILKESFGTFKNASSPGHQSFEKGMKKKVQVSYAWILEPELIKKSKVNSSLAECFFYKKLGHWKRNYAPYLASFNPNRLRKRN